MSLGTRYVACSSGGVGYGNMRLAKVSVVIPVPAHELSVRSVREGMRQSQSIMSSSFCSASP